MKTPVLLCLAFLLTGCGMFQDKPDPEPQVKVIHEEVELAIYHPPRPEPVKFQDITWFVITKENLQSRIQQIEHLTGNGFVIMAITPKDYENQAYNMQEIKRFILEQDALLDYYESVTKTSEGWAELNDKKKAEQRRQFQDLKVDSDK